MRLSLKYENTKGLKKKPFNKEEIMDVLRAEPLNVGVDEILETPVTVVVKMDKKEYVKRQITNTIVRMFNATALCKDDMVIFKSEG